jgi:hypothetical protein
VPDSNRPDHVPASSPAAAKKPYTTPTLVECGSVAKLTMGKGSTSVETGQVVKKGCL